MKYISYSNKTKKNIRKNLVYRNDDFEIFVICWKNNDASPIHIVRRKDKTFLYVTNFSIMVVYLKS